MSVYFLCDSTNPSFNGVKNTSRNAHVANYPGSRLSVAQDPGRTRAVIKVFGGAKGLVNATCVITKYDDSEHDQLKIDMALIAPLEQWDNPP